MVSELTAHRQSAEAEFSLFFRLNESPSLVLLVESTKSLTNVSQTKPSQSAADVLNDMYIHGGSIDIHIQTSVIF
jgi:hypothetical protein